jgi:hypothetical protein
VRGCPGRRESHLVATDRRDRGGTDGPVLESEVCGSGKSSGVTGGPKGGAKETTAAMALHAAAAAAESAPRGGVPCSGRVHGHRAHASASGGRAAHSRGIGAGGGGETLERAKREGSS